VKALALLLLVGCGSYSTYRTTKIAPAGQTEWLFGAQATGTSAPGMGGAPMPELSIGARRGLSDRYELQASGTMLALKQFVTGSLEVAGKARLVQHGRWSLAIGAAAGYRVAESGGAIVEGAHVAAPVIAGIDLGRHQLVLAVTGGYQRWYSSGAQPVSVPFIGESIGFRWQVSESWALLPEVGTAYTPMSNFRTMDSRLFHVGLAATFTR
jgi:hypothetical protein